MLIKKIKIKKPFSGLFPIDENIKNAIKENMEICGFDLSKPIDVWNGTCIDGHTRLEAAKETGLNDVPIFEHNFKDEDEAIEYAIHNQRDRRNITDADIIRLVSVLDRRKTAGRPKELASHEATLGKTAEKTAETVGVSRAKVEKTRVVLDHADEETKQAVESGEMSINRAYKETQERRKETQTTFNKTNENIEWAKWSWNPVTGCKHGCSYCYARDIANRFFEAKFEPTFYPERLTAPQNTKVPKEAETDKGYRGVFVCSMADLFGEWVPQDWIDKILSVVKHNPQWNFIFLTKNPKRLVGIDFPENAWVGATIDVQARVKPTEDAFKEIKAKVKFVSCEPLIERITFNSLNIFDWLIVGGQSKTTDEPEVIPSHEWIKYMRKQAEENNIPLYEKPNLKDSVRSKEYP